MELRKSMELWIWTKSLWNSMELKRMLLKFHGIPWNHKCCSNGVKKVPWYHDGVIKWKHFPRCWPFVRGIHRSRWIPHKRPVTRSFDVFFDLRLNKRLSKQPWGWWFETPSWSLWRQCNTLQMAAWIFLYHYKFQLALTEDFEWYFDM